MNIAFDLARMQVVWTAETEEEMCLLKTFAIKRTVNLVLIDVDERQADESSPTFVYGVTASVEM